MLQDWLTGRSSSVLDSDSVVDSGKLFARRLGLNVGKGSSRANMRIDWGRMKEAEGNFSSGQGSGSDGGGGLMGLAVCTRELRWPLGFLFLKNFSNRSMFLSSLSSPVAMAGF
jgi:hypothetical protein